MHTQQPTWYRSGSGSAARPRWPWHLALMGLAIGLGYLSGCERAQPKIAAAKLAGRGRRVPGRRSRDRFSGIHWPHGRGLYRRDPRRVSGYLDRVSFQDGADVKAGDLLFEIDPRSYRAEVARADANIAQFKSRLERLCVSKSAARS